MMFVFCDVFWAYTIIIISGLSRVAVAICRIHDSPYIVGFGRGIAHKVVILGKIGKIRQNPAKSPLQFAQKSVN